MAPANVVCIELWNPDPARPDSDLALLGELLRDCVHAGASVSFVLPFSQHDAAGFWRDQVLPAVYNGTRRVLLAFLEGQLAGTVQLDLATPPNQPHRADVKKLMVHPRARRRGIARMLMAAIEDQAREARRTLLTLDTVTGGLAESLYSSMEWITSGIIPGYALNFDSSVLESTTVMYKMIS